MTDMEYGTYESFGLNEAASWIYAEELERVRPESKPVASYCHVKDEYVVWFTWNDAWGAIPEFPLW